MECSYSKEKRMCKTAANLGMEDATGDWIFMKDGCAEPKKPEGKCVGEITSKNADCEPIDNKEECESKGKGIMSDGYCDWIPDTDDDACAKLTKCGECMDNMDCAYEMTKKKCMTAADMDEDDLTGDWAFVKESCPAPEDECNKPYTCEECMDQEMCTYSKEKRMCKTAANLGMEDATGDWIFMKDGCAEDACAKLTKCGECMDNMDCAYEMTKEKCMTAADMDEDDLRGDWAFMKESCPAPEDECNKPYTCEECMDNM